MNRKALAQALEVAFKNQDTLPGGAVTYRPDAPVDLERAIRNLATTRKERLALQDGIGDILRVDLKSVTYLTFIWDSFGPFCSSSHVGGFTCGRRLYLYILEDNNGQGPYADAVEAVEPSKPEAEEPNEEDEEDEEDEDFDEPIYLYPVFAAVDAKAHPRTIAACIARLLADNGEHDGLQIFGSLPTMTENHHPETIDRSTIEKAYGSWMDWAERTGWADNLWINLQDELRDRAQSSSPMEKALRPLRKLGEKLGENASVEAIQAYLAQRQEDDDEISDEQRQILLRFYMVGSYQEVPEGGR